MSYYTHFTGQFNSAPYMTAEEVQMLSEFVEKRHEGPEFPDFPYCQWEPTPDGSGIRYTDNETSSYFYEEWLTYLIEHFMKPWGLTLSGAVTYEGEEASHQGTLWVHNNEVKDVPNQIVVPQNPFLSAPPSAAA